MGYFKQRVIVHAYTQGSFAVFVRISVVRQLVTETSLIVCQYTDGDGIRRMQYDRLSQQQLSFL